MKFNRIFLIFLSTFQIYSCNSVSNHDKITQSSDNNIMSNIGFSKKIIDFGILSNDTNVKAVFYIRNTGIEYLIIKEVSPECSCTGYKLDNDTILPGDSTRLLVNFSTKGKGWGLQRKVINIRSNTAKEYNTLFIKCNIIQNLNQP